MWRSKRRGLLPSAACGVGALAVLVGCIFFRPRVEVEPSSLEFCAVPGGESPPSRVVEITDPLDSTPPYEATATADWLTVADWWNYWLGMPQWDWIWGKWVVSVSTEGLPEGEYHAEVEITDADGFVVATVPVTLTISQDVFIGRGVIRSHTTQPVLREVVVSFVEATPQADMLAVIDGLGAAVLTQYPLVPEMFLVETPLGCSLNEAVAYFEASPLVQSADVHMLMLVIDPSTGHYLAMEGGTEHLFHDDPAYLDAFVREWVVEVRGMLDYARLGGVPAVDVCRVDVIGPNYLTIHGTVALAGPSDEYLLLIADSGDVWELLGSVADEVADLSAIDGAGITITGIDKGVSVDAHSGGLVLDASSYELD